MVLTLDLNKRYTYADYLNWADNVRRELIEGFIKLFPAPRVAHAKVSFNITWHLGAILKKNKGKCEVFYAPFDVRFPKNGETENDKIYTVVQPDICVVCDLSKLDDAGCCGAPDMIVEIFSPSTGKRDTHEKFMLYEGAGVKEYWIVYPKDKAVNVFILQDDGKYNDGHVYEDDGKIPIHIFDGYSMEWKDIFP